MYRLLAVLCVVMIVTVGCASASPERDDDAVALGLPATPATSAGPAPDAGIVFPRADAVTALAVDPLTGTVAVAVASPPRLVLYPAGNLAVAPRALDLPDKAEQLSVVGEHVFVPLRAAGRLLRVPLAGGEPQSIAVAGGPVSVTACRDRIVVGLADQREIAVLHDVSVERVFGGDFRSVRMVIAVGDRVTVVDDLRSTVTEVNPFTAEVGATLRGGDGATHAVRDRFNRILAVDTKSGELLIFSVNPLILRQRYPVPGTPYGIAYDATRDIAWITITERNELVGYGVASGEPVERYRFPTVAQPYSVAVNHQGHVLVGSARGGGIQVIRP